MAGLVVASGPPRADEEVLHREDTADDRQINVKVHIWDTYQLPPGLAMPPVVRSRNALSHAEVSCQARAEVVKGLDVAVGPVDVSCPMVEVDVGGDKQTAVGQQLCYLSELPFLVLSDILKYALRHDEVELTVGKSDWCLEEVNFPQIRGGISNRYIDTEVRDAWCK